MMSGCKIWSEYLSHRLSIDAMLKFAEAEFSRDSFMASTHAVNR